MRVGYIIKRVDENGKETFKYHESNATRRIGVRSDTVKIPFLYGTTPYEEIDDNTNMMSGENGLIIVNEPFFTNKEMKERCERWCEWANSCEHREYSFFGEQKGDE